MAARRKNGRFVSGGSGSDQIVVVAPSATPARRASGGGIRRRRRSGGSRKRRNVRGTGRSIATRVQDAAVGGFIFGQIKKNFGASIPRVIPGLGTAGHVAVGIALLKPSNKYLQDAGIAAAAIAGASFGETGTISGDAGEEDVLTDD